jgi:uncharacterized coiled-coil DUF342 family protein
MSYHGSSFACRVHETDVAATSLRSQVSSLNERVRVLTSELEASRAELRAAHEDLEALVKENQMVRDGEREDLVMSCHVISA